MAATRHFKPGALLRGIHSRRRPRHTRLGRRRGKLHRRLLAYRDVVIFHSPAPASEQAQSLLLVYVRRVVGEVTYEVCDHCASGVITQVHVSTPLQDSGLGTRAVSHLRACYPDITWRCSLPQRMTRDLAHRMRLPNNRAGLDCPHLRNAAAANSRGRKGRARR
ncbi:hypothetical protein ACIQU1_08685 [Streptomyces angustmyceticus]|uniref:hypothetical protein n=1 Tax=Streptomyces angustmyceticus TaxID=285578 RepID=UPI0038197863